MRRLWSVVVLILLLLLLGLEACAVRLGAEIGLMESILAIGGIDGLILALLAVLVFLLRLFLFFVAPGWALLSLVSLFWPSRRVAERQSED